MKILFIGDVFGKPGRTIIKNCLKKIKERYLIDLVIANVENSAHGKGVTPKILNQLIQSGIDFFTLGNHAWNKKEQLNQIFNNYQNIVRPLNLNSSFKYSSLGQGSKSFLFKNKRIRITNLLGNSVIFRGNQTNCFLSFSSLLDSLPKEKEIHIVDLHAETTSEKNAFLWSFNGKVSAIVGTHTHVPTNDFVITNEGTAYITDVGMTGPSCGIIGGERNSIIKKFFYPESKFTLEPQEGPTQLCSVLLTFDEKNNPIDITPIILREGFKNDKYKLINL